MLNYNYFYRNVSFNVNNINYDIIILFSIRKKYIFFKNKMFFNIAYRV